MNFSFLSLSEKKLTSIAFLLLVSFFSLPYSVNAATSTNFSISQDGAGPSEGDASSSNFQLKWKVGLPASGQMISTGFVLEVGTRWFETSTIVTTTPPTTTPTTTPTPTTPPIVTVPGGGGGGGGTVPPTSTPTSSTSTVPVISPVPTTTPNAGTGSTSTPPSQPPVLTSNPTPASPGTSNNPPSYPSSNPSSVPINPIQPTVPGGLSSVPTTSGQLPSGYPVYSTSSDGAVAQPTDRSRGDYIPRQENSLNKTTSTRRVGKSTSFVGQKNIQRIREIAQSASSAVAAIALATLVLQTPLLSLFHLLQLLFLQPILLLGYGRRSKAGLVYNTLNKMPIDLALVRLYDEKTGRIIQSRVTNKDGLFFFQAPPGMYRIQVVKEAMVFPSKLLSSQTTDGSFANIYHGELISVSEQFPLITPNIPLDPAEISVPPSRLFWERWGRIAQNLLGGLGILVTVVAIILSPATLYLYILLAVHIGLFIVFRRLAMPPKPKGWGIVYDAKTKKPIGHAVARLFNTQYNKLVATQVTDQKGRYYFLAGDSNYQVRFEHKEYDGVVSDPIDLAGKKAETIDLQVGLQKKSSSSS